jgi:hypothetical protein
MPLEIVLAYLKTSLMFLDRRAVVSIESSRVEPKEPNKPRELEWEGSTSHSTVVRVSSPGGPAHPDVPVRSSELFRNGAIAANCYFIIFLLDAIMDANPCFF